VQRCSAVVLVPVSALLAAQGSTKVKAD